MLAAGDLRFLSNWCDRRGIQWSPGSSEQPYMLLKRHAAAQPWQRKLLQGSAATLQLLDEAGLLLAEASTLPALLDAVDAEEAQMIARTPAADWRPSPSSSPGGW